MGGSDSGRTVVVGQIVPPVIEGGREVGMEGGRERDDDERR